MVARSTGVPLNLAGSGSGQAAVTGLSPTSGQSWPCSVSQSVMTKSICGASGPVNSFHDLQRSRETSWPSVLSLSITSGIGPRAGSEPAE